MNTTPFKKIEGEEQKVVEPNQQGVIATPFQWIDPVSIPIRKWLYGRHSIRQFISATIAPGGVGKTSNQLVETISLVAKRDLLKNGLNASGRCWYIGLEDPLEEYQRRISAICIEYNIAPLEIVGGLWLDSGRNQDFIIAREGRRGVLIAEPVVESIIENINSNEIIHVSVDPFVACHEVKENDNSAIDAVVRQWAHIADVTGAAIELVHHVRKLAPGQEMTAEDARGAKALIDRTRSVRLLSAMTEKEAEKAGVEERRRYFRITSGKANLILPSDKATWRQLLSVSLGNGQGGPDDQVQVAAEWCWPDAFDGRTTEDLRRVQKRIAAGEWRADVQAKAWVGKAVAEELGLDPDNKAHRAKIKTMLKTWEKNGALKRETRTDPARRTDHPFIVVGGALNGWSAQPHNHEVEQGCAG
jgi:hypothetical protein